MTIELDYSQREAAENILGWISCGATGALALSGSAGTGKSTVVGEYLLPNLVLHQKMRVAVCTPTGRAARVIAEKMRSDVKAQLRHLGTVHSFMYEPVFDEHKRIIGWNKKHANQFHDVDLVVVDEASMVDEAMENDILSLGLPVLAVGDSFQLQPVNGTSTWMANPNVVLETVHRQALNSPVLRLATYVREHGKLPRDLSSYNVKMHLKLTGALPQIYGAYASKGKENVAVACFTNRNRCQINDVIQRDLFGEAIPFIGTQVVCLQNNRTRGIYNGERAFMTGKLMEHGNMLNSSLDMEFGDKTSNVTFPKHQFCNPAKFELINKEHVLLDYGMALTCHKLQGSCVDEVFILADIGKAMEDYPRWMYTAVSRAVSRVSLISRI